MERINILNHNNDNIEEKNENTPNDQIENRIQVILDQIHYHYLHTFDIGYRLKLAEREKINKIKTFDMRDELQTINNQIVEINKLLLNKNDSLTRMQNANIKYNKYNQITKYTNILSSGKRYSFGQTFFYWGKYKHSHVAVAYSGSTGMRKDWEILAKYTSFKEELIDNKICSVNINEWNAENDKAKLKLETDYAKTLIAEETKYGILENQSIHLNHLLAIIFYCGYSTLSFKFSETFRKLASTEMNRELKKRHSHFYFLSKFIHEAIHVFSKESILSKYKQFYHGISKNYIFDSMSSCMNQPFSTTAIYEVARAFSNKTGIILQLNPNIYLKYFNCAWLSYFSNEKELLFISTNAFAINIVNITNGLTGADYQIFIKCLDIIDSMCFGLWYNNDDNGTVSDMYVSSDYQIVNPKLLGAKPISFAKTVITIKLIKNELNRYNKKNYDKCSKLPSYIDALFHHICITKYHIEMDLRVMNMDIIDDYASGFGGFCGYKFLKYLFIKDEMINLNFVKTLYPNLQAIHMRQLKSITPRTLDVIWNFLKQNVNKTKNIEFLQLFLDRNSSDNIILSDLISKDVQLKFGTLKYMIFEQTKIYHEHVIGVGMKAAQYKGLQFQLITLVAKSTK